MRCILSLLLKTKLLLTPVISSNREIVHAGRRLSEELTGMYRNTSVLKAKRLLLEAYPNFCFLFRCSC